MKAVDTVVDFFGDLFKRSKFSKVKKCYAENVDFILDRSTYNQAPKEFFDFYQQHETAQRKVADYLIPDNEMTVEELFENSNKWADVRIRMEHFAFMKKNPWIKNLEL